MSAEQIQIYFKSNEESIFENWDDNLEAQIYYV